MKLTFLLLTCFVVQAFASLNAQTVTIKKQNASLEEVIWELKQQTRFTFMYNNEDIAQIKGIDLNEKEVDVEKILQKCLKNTNLEYVVLNNAIVIKLKMNTLDEKKSVTLKGWVYDKKKEPIPGVTVKLTNINLGTATNNKGWFSLSLPLTKGTLEFSFVGFKTQKINFTERTDTLRIILEEDVQTLDETVVVAYGTTTRRKATGAVSVVKAEEFKGIPSANIANLLQGRVAGLDITNLSGAPGGGDVAITVRGYNSLDVEAGRRFSNPLWVIDGVPLNTFTSPITGTNLLSDLNPDMIESIQILKDASSAAIYGSRAANGVIIVTTKKGRQNQDATFSVNFSETWSILPEYPALTTGRAERLLRLKSTENQFRAYLDKKTNSYKYPQSLAEQYENTRGMYHGFWFPDKNSMPE
ncbi:SusC/RagA family TonB-linked outer membrane protein, partial [Butyricimonas virosa]